VGDNWTQIAFNNVWNNNGNDYIGGPPLTGIDGNISEDPQFVDAGNNDYHLRDSSPCINTGDPDFRPATGELDFYGNARLYAGRVDIGGK
jgi:hypothetical protein